MIGVRGAVLLALVAATLACDDIQVPTFPQDAADFSEMRDLWGAQGITNYDLDLSVGSETAIEYTVRLEVRNSVASRTYDPIVEWRAPSASEHKLVIDSLYARMAAEIADPGANVTTYFDTRIGLMTFASVNRPAVLNDAYWYTVRKFRRR